MEPTADKSDSKPGGEPVRTATLLQRTGSALYRTPCKLMLVTIALSYVVVRNPPLSVSYAHDKYSVRQAEFYPLSSFPMYSSFSDRSYFVYVADGAGDPLALEAEFQVRAATLRKYYDKQLRAVKVDEDTQIRKLSVAQKKPAAEATLRHLVETLARPKPEADRHPVLELHEVIVWREGDSVRTEEARVAVLSL